MSQPTTPEPTPRKERLVPGSLLEQRLLGYHRRRFFEGPRTVADNDRAWNSRFDAVTRFKALVPFAVPVGRDEFSPVPQELSKVQHHHGVML